MLIDRRHDVRMKVTGKDVVNLIRSIPVAATARNRRQKCVAPLNDSMPSSVFGRSC
jgi:hypothetical protein